MKLALATIEENIRTARQLCEQGAWQQVLAFAQAWQQEIPTDYKALYYLALGFTGLGQFVQAETAYRRSIALDATDAKVWSNLGGLLYENLNRPIEGIRCVEHALKLNPQHKLGWSNLAAMVGRLGHHDKAIAFAERALSLDADLVEAHLHKGIAAIALGKREVAKQVCDALGAIPPEKFCRAR
jgi:tetratricopeptide (TPR) repeat protein